MSETLLTGRYRVLGIAAPFLKQMGQHYNTMAILTDATIPVNKVKKCQRIGHKKFGMGFGYLLNGGVLGGDGMEKGQECLFAYVIQNVSSHDASKHLLGL